MKSIIKLAVLGGTAGIAAYGAIKKFVPEILPDKGDAQNISNSFLLWQQFVAKYEIIMNTHSSNLFTLKNPDILKSSKSKLTHNEAISYFTLWNFMNEPLDKSISTQESNDDISKILANEDVIAVNRDNLGIVCKRVKSTILEDTILKPLKDEEFAICFFNKGNESKVFELNLQKAAYEDFIQTPIAQCYEVYDLWTKEKFDIKDNLLKYVPAHCTRSFRVRAKK